MLIGMLLPLTAACSKVSKGELSALDPAGPAAHGIAQVWNIMAWSSLAILALMVWLAFWAVRRNGDRSKKKHLIVLLVGGGLIFPACVLIALLIFGSRAGDSQLPRAGETKFVRVDVKAHQWWWEVTYPDTADGQLRSVNEIHVPDGQPIYISVTSADVIHSFWIPRLGGKIDAIPGRTNVIRLEPQGPGTYHGTCAEFCGAQHASMRMRMVVHDQDGYEIWLAGNLP